MRRYLSLGGRVRVVLGGLAALPILAVSVALATEPSRNASSVELVERVLPAQLRLEEVRAAVLDQQGGLRGFLLREGDPAYLQQYEAAGRRVGSRMAALQGLLHRGTPAAEAVALLAREHSEWQALADAALADPAGATAVAMDARAAVFGAVRSAVDRVDAALETEFRAATAKSDLARDRQRRLLGVAIAVSAIGAALGTASLTRWLRAPLDQFEAELAKMGADPTATLAAGPAELSAIATRLNQARDRVFAESDERIRHGWLVAQEQERRRIAGELHDDVIQLLAALSLRLEMMMNSASEAHLLELDGALDMNNAVMSRLRDMVFELYPPVLERYGLAPAIEAFGSKAVGTDGAAIEVEGQAPNTSLTAQALAYRIAREAILNSVKHAKAGNIRVVVGERDGGVSVEVRDDGVGFDTSAPAPVGHVGLASAEGLVLASEGTWSVLSGPEGGTTVEVWLPDPEGAAPPRAVPVA